MGKIIFIVEQISQPRCIKRIESFNSKKIPFIAWGFDKNLYNINLENQSIQINKFPYNHTNKNKFINFIKRWKCVCNIVNKSSKEDVFYLFGFDIALYTFFSFKKIIYIYEESDVTYARRKKLLFYLFRAIDNRIRTKSQLTVFTSEGFLNYFYGNYIPKNVLVQPNKLHPSLNSIKRTPLKLENINKLRFAFVGQIRYNTIFNFAKVVGCNFPNHEFHFWGDSTNNQQIKSIINTYSNVFSHGSFKNPDDLISIYSQFDILVATYDTNNFNTRIAEPNKLYESIFFCKPIIVSKDTFIEKKVLEYKIGYSLNASNIEDIKVLIENLNIKELNKISGIQHIIDTETLIDSPKQITEKISKIVIDLQ